MNRDPEPELIPPEIDGETERAVKPGSEVRVIERPPETEIPAIRLYDPKLEAALAETGMSKVNIRRLIKSKKIGIALQRAGAIQVAVGEFAYSNQFRQSIIQLCHKRLKDSKTPDDAKVWLEGILEALESKDATTKEIMKAIQTEEWRDSGRDSTPLLPPKGQVLVGVSVQNTIVNPGNNG
jgi:hypothetical protein